jgi:hypothetical protein
MLWASSSPFLATLSLGMQQLTGHLLVSSIISGKHFCYGSQVVMQALLFFWVGFRNCEVDYAGS